MNFIHVYIYIYIYIYTYTYTYIYIHQGFSGGSMVKNPVARTGDTGSIPGSERSGGVGNGNLHQYSCLGNPVDSSSLACYSPWGDKRVRYVLATKQQHIWYSIYIVIHILYTFTCMRNIWKYLTIDRFTAAVSGRQDYKLYIIAYICKFYIYCIRRSYFPQAWIWLSSADKWKIQIWLDCLYFQVLRIWSETWGLQQGTGRF